MHPLSHGKPQEAVHSCLEPAALVPFTSLQVMILEQMG